MLPKRNSRPVTIDNVQYRWALSKGQSKLIVQSESSGAKLEVPLTEEADGLYWMQIEGDTDCAPLSSARVGKIIALAQNLGWDPSKPGPTFRIAIEAREIR